MDSVVFFLARNMVALRILKTLAVRGKLYTRQLLSAANAWDKYGLDALRQLEAHGLVKRIQGEVCDRSGRLCRKVVWNVITPAGLEALRALGVLDEVEEVLAEEHAAEVEADG